VSQDLFSLAILASGLRKAIPSDSTVHPQVETMEITARAAQREMQALLLELRPIALEDAGLSVALGELCRAYQSRLGVEVTAQIAELDAAPAVEHAVLRIAQEAMANAIRHAEPTAISLSVDDIDDSVVLRVQDNGSGFDPATLAQTSGLGVRSMNTRAHELGGSITIDTNPGAGTVLTAVIPARGQE
jgi:signal transduction histidine kinase